MTLPRYETGFIRDAASEVVGHVADVAVNEFGLDVTVLLSNVGSPQLEGAVAMLAEDLGLRDDCYGARGGGDTTLTRIISWPLLWYAIIIWSPLQRARVCSFSTCRRQKLK